VGSGITVGRDQSASFRAGLGETSCALPLPGWRHGLERIKDRGPFLVGEQRLQTSKSSPASVASGRLRVTVVVRYVPPCCLALRGHGGSTADDDHAAGERMAGAALLPALGTAQSARVFAAEIAAMSLLDSRCPAKLFFHRHWRTRSRTAGRRFRAS